MTIVRAGLLAVVFATGTTTLACNKDKDKDRAGQTTTTSAGNTTGYQLATARIADARCDREISCEQVGREKRFTTRESCAREEEKRTQTELKSTECPNGIDESKLQKCLTAVSKQECSSLVTSLQNVDACKTAALCLVK